MTDLQSLMEQYRITVEPSDKQFAGTAQAWIARPGDIPSNELTGEDCFYGLTPLDATWKLVQARHR